MKAIRAFFVGLWALTASTNLALVLGFVAPRNAAGLEQKSADGWALSAKGGEEGGGREDFLARSRAMQFSKKEKKQASTEGFLERSRRMQLRKKKEPVVEAAEAVAQETQAAINAAQDTSREAFLVRSRQRQLQKSQQTTISRSAVVSDKPRILISGAPASGKGTQCELLKDKYGLVHLSTGDMLREEVKKQTFLGRAAQEYMDEGELVPDELIISMVQERLAQADCVANGWLLDGFPRTAAQAQALRDAGVAPTAFVLLDVPDRVLLERAMGRRVDPVTGRIYHLAFDPPPPEVSGRVEQRADDEADKVINRLATYHEHVDNVIFNYKDILTKVDGTQSKEAIFSIIESVVDDNKSSGTKEAIEEVKEFAKEEPQKEVAGGRPDFEPAPAEVEMASSEVLPDGAMIVETAPIGGMKPGTSGLRKKVSVVSEGLYLHNFVQSIFDVLPADELKGATLLVSGDGRYYNREALQVIVEIAAANGVGRVWIGKGGLMSTPAASATLRTRENGAAYGGIVLTASHNPGGPDEDFGIKYNTGNGAPATETLTDQIYERTLRIERIKTMKDAPTVDLDTLGTTQVGGMVVEVIDPVEDYLAVLEQQFDFPALRALVAREDFDLVFDGMGGVGGAYARQVLVEALGADPACLLRCEPSETFNGDHPDPNLTYAKALVQRMGLSPAGAPWPLTDLAAAPPQFGAASDGDADRNMILGERFFVTPSDSVAVLAAHADAVPGLYGLRGVARSMPTSGALDRVAERKGLRFFETPTGWKFFGNLMDSKALGGATYTPFICGEESFGTGSDHVREKDGLWAVLAWLSVLAKHNPDPAAPLVGVEDIVRAHWAEYGRNFYARYDYEAVDLEAAEAMMDHLRALIPTVKEGDEADGFVLRGVDEFEYTDPVDGSRATRQGVRVLFADGSRVVFRLSGTGSVGATVRVYVEKYEEDPDQHFCNAQGYVRDLAEAGLRLARLEEFTGRQSPTVIT